MADLTEKEASGATKIVGGDEAFEADVFQDKDGFNKLFVKSSVVSVPLGNLFFLKALLAGSPRLNVNGSNPKEFLINAEVGFSLFVDSLLFSGLDGGIRVDKFLGKGSILNNGVIVEVKSEDTLFQFLPIKITQQFDSHFAFGPGRSFELISASGDDSVVSRFGPRSPFLLAPVGTYATDDYIKVIIQDNLSSVSNLEFLAKGSREAI